MKILLIGGNGFIGSHLMDKLLNSGHSVRILDRGPEKFRKPNENVEYFFGAITENKILFEAMKGMELIIHLVSSSVPSSSNNNVKNDVINNILPTISILDNMVKLKIKKIVYFSSGGAIYGNSSNLPIKEGSPLNPISSYGITKLTNEKYIKLYSQIHKIEHLIIRPSNPYGPRQGHFAAQGIISTFLRKIKDGGIMEIFGDGENRKDYIFIEDLVDRVSYLVNQHFEGVYNIGSGIANSTNQIKELTLSTTNSNQTVNYVQRKAYDVSDFVLDIDKIQKACVKDVPALIDIEEGIKKTWEWIKIN